MLKRPTWLASAALGARLAAGGEGTGILVGFSGGVERRNNLDDLTPVTIETQVASAVRQPRRQSRRGEKCLCREL